MKIVKLLTLKTYSSLLCWRCIQDCSIRVMHWLHEPDWVMRSNSTRASSRKCILGFLIVPRLSISRPVFSMCDSEAAYSLWRWRYTVTVQWIIGFLPKVKTIVLTAQPMIVVYTSINTMAIVIWTLPKPGTEADVTWLTVTAPIGEIGPLIASSLG